MWIKEQNFIFKTLQMVRKENRAESLVPSTEQVGAMVQMGGGDLVQVWGRRGIHWDGMGDCKGAKGYIIGGSVNGVVLHFEKV